MDAAVEEIAARLGEVRQRIAEAAVRVGRPPEAVRLVAVSKTKPAALIRAAHAAGQRDFGENYVQELDQKAHELADLEGIRWHAIGQLQRNKVKQVVRLARTVHAVDREELAREIDRRAEAAGVVIEGLVEVNLEGELSKGGVSPEGVGPLLAAVAGLRSLRIVGLMTIPPPTEDPEAARPMFAALRALRDRHGGAAALPELSMGMTHDYTIAVEEGATLVRVGTALFGARS